MKEHRIAVRELAEFLFRSGDIDYRFTPSPSGIQGMEGHAEVYRRRPDSYQSEVSLEHRRELGDVSVTLRGRADGYDAEAAYIEEIKTTRVPAEGIPAAVKDLHLAQAQLYAAMLCLQDSNISALGVQLCYFNIDSGQETLERQERDRESLLQFLDEALLRYGDWLAFLSALQDERDDSIEQLVFPHDSYRRGQREMAETTYKCMSTGGRLLLEAPTGIGKTAAVLFPAVKALGAGKHESFAFVTAKTIGARAAEETFQLLDKKGLALSRLTVTAKDKVCFSPGKACHGEDCPYARGYYDRLPAAREAALHSHRDLTREVIEDIAREHKVCPYQLAADLLPWVDACIADIHHFYSFYAAIAARLNGLDRQWGLVLDEAHNLPDRAIGMFSAELSKSDLMDARREIKSGPLRKSLDAINAIMLELDKDEWKDAEAHSLPDAPADLINALSRFTGLMGEQQSEQLAWLQGKPLLLNFYFAVIQFQRVLESWGDDYRFELQRRPGRKQSLRLKLNCIDPARLLAERQQLPHSVTAFSATVSPPAWMSRSLGFDEEAVFLGIESPFEPSQLQVDVMHDIDTRYRQREQTLPALAMAIDNWLIQEQGNCIVYFPSYAYMDSVLERIQPSLASRPVLIQEQGMGESARADFIDVLTSRSGVVAFCILGGVFGEGIDLPGEALSSVVIVGVGLPQYNRDTQLRRDYYQQAFSAGFEFAYLYPGMQKVNQALGRVVRGPADEGRALLIDQRYGEPAYRDLLAPHWFYKEQT